MAAHRPFQLTRYFTLTSLVAFGVLALALFLLQGGEIKYFAQVEKEQSAFFTQVQSELLKQQKETARANLLAVYDSGQSSLARVFTNALWTTHFAPLVAQAQSIPLEACPKTEPGDVAGAQARRDCIARVGRKVRSLPAFAGVEPPVRALMQGSSVFKIKVYDLRGLTVFSSDPEMVGEEKSGNAGWQAAAAGRSASELVHRDQLSVFENVVKNRDLIQSYIPAIAPGGGVAGVFEIYSDVTPLLQQLEAASARGADIIASNQARMQQGAARNLRDVESASDRFLLTIYGMLLVTYAALLVFVRSGQRIIDREARAREQAARREEEWHRDKMATMGAMAANISHNVGNPLAIISGLAEEVAHASETGAPVNPEHPRIIVEQTTRIAGMTRRITHFASAGRDAPELVDINERIRSVSEFLRFDRRFHGAPIKLQLGDSLPACEVIPDHLTEVLMGMLQALEQGCAGCENAHLQVRTTSEDGEVIVRISGECPGAGEGCVFPLGDPRLDSARRRMDGMRGRVEPAGNAVEIRLPAVALDRAG